MAGAAPQVMRNKGSLGSKDLHLENFSVSNGGAELIEVSFGNSGVDYPCEIASSSECMLMRWQAGVLKICLALDCAELMELCVSFLFCKAVPFCECVIMHWQQVFGPGGILFVKV